MKDLNVIIIGAGIGGLTTGIALAQLGYKVSIYDRVQILKPVGAGISLWSNGVKVLNALGLGQEIAAIGGTMTQMQYRWKSGQLLNDIPLLPLVEKVGQCPYPVARGDLQEMLFRACAALCEIHLGHECIAVTQEDAQVQATFQNGLVTTGDVLIAADGVRSRLRTYVLGTELSPQYAGYVNWNGLVDWSPELVPLNNWVIYVGDHKRASLMPVANSRCYFFFDVPLNAGTQSSPEAFRAELTHYFQGWADPVQKLIQQLNPEKTARLDIRDVGPVDRLVRSRVALLGDAGHTTCPDLGQGGCQALEDAWMIARCLEQCHSVEAALSDYQSKRLDRVNNIVNKARNRAEVIHGKNPEATEAWYQQLARESAGDVRDAIGKIILEGVLA